MAFLKQVFFDDIVIKQLLNSCSTFPEFLNKLLKIGDMSQADLAAATGISKPTISRMCSFSYTGKLYVSSLSKIQAICTYFKIYGKTRKRVFYLAFSVFEVWDEIDAKKLDIIDANILLDNNGYPPLGE